MTGARNQKTHTLRYLLVLALFTLLGATIIGRLFFLQMVRGDYYLALARGQQKTFEELDPRRGDIVLETRLPEEEPSFVAATTKEWKGVYLVPQDIREPERVIEELHAILGIDRKVLEEKVSRRDDPYEPLEEKVEDEKIAEIRERNLEGVKISQNRFRFYPYDSLLSHAVGFMGFVGDTRQGRYGLEEYYHEELSGISGLAEVEQGIGVNPLVFVKNLLKPVRDGSDLVLTIDYNIQSKTEEILTRYIDKWSGEGGSIVVADPKTGAIIAMSSRPNFDLNRYNEVSDADIYLNPVTQKIFEPGSIFKPITMAGALNEEVIGPHTTYFDEGEARFGSYTIKNSDLKSHGIQTMTQVLEKSLNTGAIYVEKLLGKERFQEYVKRFRFGEKTGVDLPGELSGDISNLNSGRDINYATASFGQGIAVTPIELIAAFSAIANGGTMMKPYVVETILHSDGTSEERTPTVLAENIISPATASRLTAMMVSVVKNGYSSKAGIPGYLVAGKSGTAQVPKKDGVGYSDKTVHTFIGYAPAFNPRFVALIKLDNPKGIRFSSDSIAPAFRELGEYILTYYEISPQ